MRTWIAVVIAIALAASFAFAGAKPGIDIASFSEVEVPVKDAQGMIEMKRVEAAKAVVVPGKVVIFTNRYVNNGAAAAENIAIVNPIPKDMIYKFGSASGENADVRFSVDGGKTYDTTDNLFVIKKGKRVLADVSDYTHIKWTINKPLQPGAKGEVTFRAIVK